MSDEPLKAYKDDELPVVVVLLDRMRERFCAGAEYEAAAKCRDALHAVKEVMLIRLGDSILRDKGCE